MGQGLRCVVVAWVFSLGACSGGSSKPDARPPDARDVDARAIDAPADAANPVVTFTTFQNASVVIGQADFTHESSNQGGAAGANTVSFAIGNVLVNAGKLYLGDQQNNRVLVFNSIPATNGASADLVVGQPDLTTVTPGTTAAKTRNPTSVTTAAGKLLVADAANSRVLIFNAIPAVSGAAGDVAVGQPDLVTNTQACTASKLSFPQSVFVSGSKLLVADSVNNRVLIWNSIPTATGASADLVLGQADFTHCTANAGGTTSAGAFDYPTDVWSDGTRLVVVDQNNNRVLIWNTFPTANNVAADLVLGQTDFTSSAAAGTQTGFDSPFYVASNGKQLFVSDQMNDRVMVWSTFPVASGAGADVVLGQSDFTHVAPNDDNQDTFSDSAPTARTLANPSGVALWGTQLFVADEANSRYLVYNGQ